MKRQTCVNTTVVVKWYVMHWSTNVKLLPQKLHFCTPEKSNITYDLTTINTTSKYAVLMMAVCMVGGLFCPSTALGIPEFCHAEGHPGELSVSPIGPSIFSDPRIPAFPQADYDGLLRTSDTTIPEPGTFLLLLPGVALLSYNHWRRKTHGARKTHGTMTEAITVMKIPFEARHIRQERLAMIGRRTDEVVHDIKNALTGMRTCAEVIGYKDLSPEDRQELASLLVNDIDQVMTIAEDLLEFSRGNHQTLDIRRLSVKDEVQKLLAQLTCSTSDQNITIQTDLRYTGDFHADAGKIQRVLLNLATNALDAMPDDGMLTIATRAAENDVQFEIRDTGCGMTPECQAQMFDPFFTHGKPRGTGLGMVIVKDIIEAHHGHIVVQSNVGKGTTIRVSLPL